MAARRIGQYVPDWVKLGSKCLQEEKPNLFALRAKFETIKTGLDTVSAKPEPINWEFYTKNVSKPGMVEAFMKAYDAVTVPFPKDVETTKINDTEKEMEERAIAMIKTANEQIASSEAQLAEIKALKPFEEMTIDEYAALHPEWTKQCEEEIARNDWRV